MNRARRATTLAAAALAALAFTGTPQAWAAVGFTNQGTESGWSDSLCPAGRIDQVGGPTRSGPTALRFEARWGEPDPGGRYHCEVHQEKVSSKFAQAWAGFSVYVPQPSGDYLNEGTFMQWKTNTVGRKPMLMLQSLQRGQLQVKIFSGDPYAEDLDDSAVIKGLGSLPYGQWVDFVVHQDFRADDQGRLKIWKNDQLVLDYTGKTAYAGTYDVDFHAGMYAGQWTHVAPPAGARSLARIDSVRIGDASSSKAEVAPR